MKKVQINNIDAQIAELKKEEELLLEMKGNRKIELVNIEIVHNNVLPGERVGIMGEVVQSKEKMRLQMKSNNRTRYRYE